MLRTVEAAVIGILIVAMVATLYGAHLGVDQAHSVIAILGIGLLVYAAYLIYTKSHVSSSPIFPSPREIQADVEESRRKMRDVLEAHGFVRAPVVAAGEAHAQTFMDAIKAKVAAKGVTKKEEGELIAVIETTNDGAVSGSGSK